MIIFGFGRRSRKDRGAVVPVTCPRCNNETTYRWISTTTWFSLFFVPVIPYSNKHFLVCPVCSNGRELTRAQAQHAAALLPHTQAALATGMQDPEYVQHVSVFWTHLGGGQAPAPPPPLAQPPAASPPTSPSDQWVPPPPPSTPPHPN